MPQTKGGWVGEKRKEGERHWFDFVFCLHLYPALARAARIGDATLELVSRPRVWNRRLHGGDLAKSLVYSCLGRSLTAYSHTALNSCAIHARAFMACSVFLCAAVRLGEHEKADESRMPIRRSVS